MTDTIRLNFSNARIVDITECEWKDLRIVIHQMKRDGTESMPEGFVEAAYGCVHIGPTERAASGSGTPMQPQCQNLTSQGQIVGTPATPSAPDATIESVRTSAFKGFAEIRAEIVKHVPLAEDETLVTGVQRLAAAVAAEREACAKLAETFAYAVHNQIAGTFDIAEAIRSRASQPAPANWVPQERKEQEKQDAGLRSGEGIQVLAEDGSDSGAPSGRPDNDVRVPDMAGEVNPGPHIHTASCYECGHDDCPCHGGYLHELPMCNPVAKAETFFHNSGGDENPIWGGIETQPGAFEFAEAYAAPLRQQLQSAQAEVSHFSKQNLEWGKCAATWQARAEKAEAELQKYHSDLADENLKRLRAEEDTRTWKSHWEMYAAAWLRELGGELLPKHHHIDALVKTTKYHKERSDRCERAEAELASLKAAGEGWIPCSQQFPNFGELVDVVINGIVQNSPALYGDAGDEGYAWYWLTDSDPAPEKAVSHWRKRPTFTLSPAPAKPVEGPAAKEGK